MTKKIVVFGSIVQDLISYTNDFPKPGETILGNSFLTGGGGKGANQAVAASRIVGENVTFLGRVGDDIFGEANLSGLGRAGIQTEFIQKSNKNPTATALITVNKEGENTIVVTLGANLEMTAEAADQGEEVIASAGILVAQAEIPQEGNKRAFELAKKHNVKTFFNPAPGDRNMDVSLLSLVDIICTNENEAEFVTKITVSSVETAQKAAQKMIEFGPNCAIVTLGSQGAVIATKSEVTHISVEKTQVVDTTGAGDCFCGTFCALLMAGFSEIEAAKSAVRVAALSVQRKGTQSSYWTKQEIVDKFPDIVIQ